MTLRRPALAIMAKQPVPGRTKTRLQPLLGPDGAAHLYRCLLLDTIDLARSVPGVEVVLAIDPETSGPYFTDLAPDLPQLVQKGAELGDRLDYVLGTLLDRGHHAVAAIGSDSPTLPPEAITDAFRRLAAPGVDTVLGPADDGGYHLIAVTDRPGVLVTGVTMSTPDVLADTLAVAQRVGRRVALGRPWYDVDEPDDLDRLRSELQRHAEVAPHTRAGLAELAAANTTGPDEPASGTARGPTGTRPAAGVAVVVPALDEAGTIAEVVRRCLDQGVGRVFVVDNGSTDDTAANAAGAGAEVVTEARRGYGWACAAGVGAALDAGAEVVAFADGDLSSPPEELPAVFGPVLDGLADLVMGSRVQGAIAPGAMALHQRLGNAFAAWLLRRLYPVAISDLGPFRAIRASLMAELDMTEMTYGWPTEMTVKAANAGARIVEVPVSWLPRAAGHSKVSGTIRGSVLAARYIVGVTVAHSHALRRLSDRFRMLRAPAGR